MQPRSLTALLVFLAAAEVPAQPQRSHAPRPKREVRLTGAPGESTVICGTADMPVTLVFDLPPRKTEVTLTVPLADGSSVPLVLSFAAEQVDTPVRLSQRPASIPEKQGVETLPREALLTAVELAARAVLGPPEATRCLPVKGIVPVEPFENSFEFLACRIEEWLFVRADTKCQAATARLLADSYEAVEAAWVESEFARERFSTYLALRAPPPAVVAGLVLEAHSQDGALCERLPLEPK
jgi:hypothetical protein